MDSINLGNGLGNRKTRRTGYMIYSIVAENPRHDKLGKESQADNIARHNKIGEFLLNKHVKWSAKTARQNDYRT